MSQKISQSVVCTESNVIFMPQNSFLERKKIRALVWKF